jgi:uncharacterized protein (DUF305 family)
MTAPIPRSALLLAVALGACSSGRTEPAAPTPATTAPTTTQPTATHAGHATHADPATMAAAASADSLRDSFSQADVDFITHMIPHHAQALVMARMVPTHTTTSSLQVLAGRIINAQNDEIRLMQRWLSDRGLPVPDPEHALHSGQHMGMPGMLTPEQLARLDAAREAEFDRLFLQFMIQHHTGAIAMVNELFSQHGAAQGDAIFKIASDINVDQETEIERMRLMLRDLLLETEGL